MEVSARDVILIFLKILNGDLSLADADRWAFVRKQACDYDGLIFFPEKDKDKIWGGIMYLYGIDLEVEPGISLHFEHDIKHKLIQLFGVDEVKCACKYTNIHTIKFV